LKIVHFDDLFHPDFGYQINVLTRFQQKQGHEVIIVSSADIDKHPVFSKFGEIGNLPKKDKDFEERTNIKVIRLPFKKIISSRVIYKKSFIKFLEELEPDVLLCHQNDTVSGMILTRYALRAKFPIVFDSHMLEMGSANKLRRIYQICYKAFFASVIKKLSLKVIRTQDDPYVEKCLGIPLSQAPFISFGTDTECFYPDKDIKSKFRNENKIADDEFVIVYTGKLDNAKGGKFLAQSFEKMLFNNKKKNIVLIVIGNSNGDYGQDIEKIFSKSENRIIRFSTQRYIDLPKFYQASDLSIFPKQCSLSFYDAQACGLPVISEDNNINVDRLQYNNGFNFRTGDMEDFRDQIIKCVEMDESEYKQIGINAYEFAKQNYNYEDIAQKYTDILIQEYNKFKVGHIYED